MHPFVGSFSGKGRYPILKTEQAGLGRAALKISSKIFYIFPL